MKKLIISKITLLAVLNITIVSLSSFSYTVQASYTNYVTDSLKLPIRTNPGFKYKIIKTIESGSKVTILKVNDKNWAKVSYLDKKKNKTYEGWMPTVILQNTPIAKVRLKYQISKTSKVEKKYNQLKIELQALNNRLTETNVELKETKARNFSLSKNLTKIKAISGKSIILSEKNAEYAEKIKELNSEKIIMKERVSEAEDIVQRQWFLTGGGVLLLGLLLGRFFRIPAKKNRWDTFS